MWLGGDTGSLESREEYMSKRRLKNKLMQGNRYAHRHVSLGRKRACNDREFGTVYLPV